MRKTKNTEQVLYLQYSFTRLYIDYVVYAHGNVAVALINCRIKISNQFVFRKFTLLVAISNSKMVGNEMYEKGVKSKHTLLYQLLVWLQCLS